jgi:hypothetical protein
MSKSFTILSSVAALFAAAFVASPAHAEDATLQFSGGPSQVLHQPWSEASRVFTNNQFKTGVEGNANLLFKLVPNLSVGPTASVQYFTPSANPNSEATVEWDFGGAVQLQGNHVAGWYPYLNFACTVNKQGSVWDPAMASAAGINFAVDPTKTYWVGAYAQWDHVFDVNRSDAADQTLALNGHDLNTFSVGLSLAFDAPVHPVHVTRVIQVPVEVPVTVTKTVQVPVVQPVPAPVTVKTADVHVVKFDFDSAVLTPATTAVLDQVVSTMTNNTADVAVVNGKASAEGDAAHNAVLSQARATAVVNYLTSKGVAASRLSTVAVGAVGVPQDASNRRAEVVITLQ